MLFSYLVYKFVIFQVATAALSKICIELENNRVSGKTITTTTTTTTIIIIIVM